MNKVTTCILTVSKNVTGPILFAASLRYYVIALKSELCAVHCPETLKVVIY